MMRWIERVIAPAIVALVVAGIANAGVWQWSHTAATNATADPSINWSEGMSPSSVNDSARAMMARIADWRDDFSGLLLTGGTPTAYTLTTNQGLTNPPSDGQLLTFTPHTTNGAFPTLRVDGGSAVFISANAAALPAGVLIAGTPYSVRYNSATNTWRVMHLFGNPDAVPVGTVLDFSGGITPSANYVFANGQCISRATYAGYFGLVGTTYGACDGSTTFGVPDLSNRFVAGSQMGGTARITATGGNFDGVTPGLTGGNQNHTLLTSEVPSITPTGTINPSSYTPTGSITGSPSVSDTRTWQSSNSLWASGASGARAGGAEFSVGAAVQTVAVASGSITVGAGSLGFSGNSQSFTFTGNAFGGGQLFSILPPVMLLTKIVRII